MCSMRCTIPGVNLKVFGRAIYSLSKIGDELYFEPLEDGLFLRAVNLSRSAYGCFQFSPNFFSNYIDNMPDKDRNSEDDDGSLRCKLGMKSILAVFKSLATIDKTVEKCRISLDSTEARLVFQMYCRHGIIKTHKLAFTECETLQAVFSKDMCPNKLTAVPKLLCDVVLNFQYNQEEITLIIRPDFMALKNYVDDEADPHKVIHTELTLSPEEFEQYQAGVDADVTFCLRELRAVLAFADITGLPVMLQFETAGRPITFSITSDLSFEANFVLATLAEAESSEPSVATGAKKSGPSERLKNTVNQNGKNSLHRNSSSSAYKEKEHSTNTSLRINNPPQCSASLRDKPGTSSAADDMMNNDEDFSVMMDVTAPEDSYMSQRPTAVPDRSMQDAEQPARKRVTFHNDTDDDEDDDGWNLNVRTARDFFSGAQPVSSQNKPAEIHRNNKEKDFTSVAAVAQQDLKKMQPVCSEATQASSDSSSSRDVHSVGRTFLSLKSSKSSDGDTSPVVPMQDTNLSRSGESDNEAEEEIPATPPSKKFRSLFFGTQSSTQSTQSQPKPLILAPDSDEEN